MFDSFDYDTLCLLRKYTNLNMLDFIKVLRQRSVDAKYQILFDNNIISSEYQNALEFEYFLRVKVWKDFVFPTWYKYANDEDLDEFAFDMLMQREEKEKKLVK